MVHLSLDSKLPSVGTTIFTVMSQLAAEYGAVNLGQGFPDFSMSNDLIMLVNKAMQDGNNQYAHMHGLSALRVAIAQKSIALYGSEISPENEITVTPGGTYAIYTALTTVLKKGDEVIVFEPAYDCYIPTIELNGAVPVLISLKYPDYSIPWDEVKAKINSRTRMIMINSPHNPTGSILGKADMQQLSVLVANTNIIILSDEVYEHLIFDGHQHQSILRYPELFSRSFVCFSFGKTYHCTGWKLGYCIAPDYLMKEFRKIHQYNCFSCDTPKQVALAAYLQNKEVYLSLGSFLQSKRDFFRQLMNDTPFKCIPSHGSYFECYSYEGFSKEGDKELAIKLTKEYGIASIPISVFYKNGEDNKVLRFCFAKKEETLEKAVKKLRFL
ncbi:MAG: aminotransferase class I/II-fold pyridoxal phosphate-dependent enzyme [Sphingobacteriia bacterium]|nr:MAG: aminotransferase class I/II-fold pyridoxal phosphate-dependent enzyme [Sphingobacteriia bacterium]